MTQEDKLQQNKRFGRKVAMFRVKRSLSQEELSKKCELNRTYIDTIERGGKSATVNTIHILAVGQLHSI